MSRSQFGHNSITSPRFAEFARFSVTFCQFFDNLSAHAFG
jgi:hypothetical protein